MKDELFESYQVTLPLVKKLVPVRSLFAHKGSVGRVLVIAGSYSMTGAAVLASQAALKTGAGLVTLATANSLAPHLDIKSVEVMCVGLPETKKLSISNKAFKEAIQYIKRSDVIAIGPGLSRNRSTLDFAERVITYCDRKRIPLIIDADALGAVYPRRTVVKVSQWSIATPHPGEFAAMIGKSLKQLKLRGLLDCAVRAAARFKRIIVLKGHHTKICLPSGRVYINPTGNPGMATAGSGDVLTGIIAGLRGQKISPPAAAIMGVYVHGLAGDFARSQKGEAGLTAQDILACLPQAIKYIAGR